VSLLNRAMMARDGLLKAMDFEMKLADYQRGDLVD
jgi:hypothetical protein